MARTADHARARPRQRSTSSTGPREVRRRLKWLSDSLGDATLAYLLDVRRAQLSRWLSGADRPGPVHGRAVLDLDYVVARLQQVWVPQLTLLWLGSPNAHLGGAVPAEVLRRWQVGEVIRAIDAAAEGAYA